jgi:hypothetical protein
VQVPDVQVPDVQVPDVQVPDVQVPDVQVPDADVPDADVPDAGDVQVPEASVPDPEAPEVTTSGGGVRVDGASAPSRSQTGATAGAGASGGPTAGARSATSAPGRRAARRRAAREPTGPPARERRLRRLVRALGDCLGALPAAQRRVLVLRAGVGPRPPRSRRAAAAVLDLPVSAVRHRERAGLARLRALGGTCGGAGPSGHAPPGSVFASLLPLGGPLAGGTLTTATDGDAGPNPAIAVLGVDEALPAADRPTTAPAALLPEDVRSADRGDAAAYVLALLAAAFAALLLNPRSRDWILRPYG